MGVVHNPARGCLLNLSTLASCADLTTEHAKQAASSSAEMRILLKRVSEIARPDQGCPKVLMAIARLVGQEWVEGDLRVELSGDESSSTLVIICDFGVGIRERLLPAAKFRVPLDEFERALELSPKLVLPLKITDEAGKIVLTPLLTPDALITSTPPPAFELDAASLGQGERSTAPPPPDELLVVDIPTPGDFLHSVHEVSTVPPAPVASDAAGASNAVHEATTAPPQASASGEHDLAPRMESGPVPSDNNPDPQHDGRISNVHTRPTVRRMVAVDAAAIAALKRRDPRREED